MNLSLGAGHFEPVQPYLDHSLKAVQPDPGAKPLFVGGIGVAPANLARIMAAAFVADPQKDASGYFPAKIVREFTAQIPYRRSVQHHVPAAAQADPAGKRVDLEDILKRNIFSAH
jgi:hypothetical protein